MKKIKLITIIAILIAMSLTKSYAQFTFSVSPGLQLNSATFGIKKNNFVPFFSLQMINGNVNYIETGRRYDSNMGSIVSYKDEYKYSLTVLAPSLGLKYFIKENNKLKAFLSTGFIKFFPFGKVEDSSDPSANEDFKENLKGINALGFQFGFGTEYFFDDNFSIGGEFGYRFLHLKYKYEDDVLVYDPNLGTDVSTKRTYDNKYNLNPTYIKLSLNFYFDKK
ncbi:MAG TPA: hypothetical protein PKK00_09365 [Bacteroidales bacterium]|nr:hypothetical protein [Bacteroidales bacterium]HPS17474.1 hypothetical protein [Bacteroidales bacterium]